MGWTFGQEQRQRMKILSWSIIIYRKRKSLHSSEILEVSQYRYVVVNVIIGATSERLITESAYSTDDLCVVPLIVGRPLRVLLLRNFRIGITFVRITFAKLLCFVINATTCAGRKVCKWKWSVSRK